MTMFGGRCSRSSAISGCSIHSVTVLGSAWRHMNGGVRTTQRCRRCRVRKSTSKRCREEEEPTSSTGAEKDPDHTPTGWGLIICAHQEATSESGCRVGDWSVGDRGVAAAGCGPAAHATGLHCLSLPETTVSLSVTWNPQMAGWQGPFRPSCPPSEPFQDDSHPPFPLRNRWRGADCGWCANPRAHQPPMIPIGPVFLWAPVGFYLEPGRSCARPGTTPKSAVVAGC